MARKSFFYDALGNPLLIKRLLIIVFGIITYHRFNIRNRAIVRGSEVIRRLPRERVLFVSNHQTYYADVAAMFHVINSSLWGFKNSIRFPVYLLNPKMRLYFVAAKETMNAGFLAKMFKIAGSVSIKRTWREAGKDVNRMVDLRDLDKIATAIDDGWVITFPQGTTKPYNTGRRGTAFLIKHYKPIVVPVTIDGFRRAFDKKGLKLRAPGVNLYVSFKEPLDLSYNESVDEIMDKVMRAIEQSEEFNLMKQLEEQKESVTS